MIYIYIYMCHCVLDWVEGPQCDLRPGKARPMDSQYNNTLYYIILYYIVLNYIILLYDMQICNELSLHHNSLVGIKSVGIIYNGIYEYIIYNLTHAKLLISDNINI